MRRSPLNSELPEDDNRRGWRATKNFKPLSPAQAVQSSSSPSARRPAAGEARAAWAVSGFLLLAVLLVFGQTARHEFVNYDDGLYVYDNPVVTRGLTAEGIDWAMTTNFFGMRHPLTLLSHMADCHFYGLNAGGHHLTNVLLHAANAVLLFFVLRRMTGIFWPAAFVAAAFAVHPQHVESVAWVAERKDVLSGLFFMLILLAYLGYVRRPSRVRYWGVVLLFALGLMAKPMLVTLPFVLLLLDYWPLGRLLPKTSCRRETSLDCNRAASESGANFADDMGSQGTQADDRGFKQLVVEKIPLLILAVVASVAILPSQGKYAENLIIVVPLWSRIANALVSYVAYLGQFFYPLGLAVLYPHPGTGLPIWQAAVALLALAALSLAALACWRRRPYVLVGWLWYVGMLVPVIGLMPVGGPHAMADRYTYLPEIGLCIAVVWGVADISRSWSSRRWILGVASAFFLALMVGCAWRQTAFWRDSETLWRHALACTTGELAHNNLGCILDGRGRVDEAIAHYREALKIKPDYVEAHNNLGNVLLGRGQIDEAIVHYREALRIMPGLAEAHNNLGNLLLGRGRVDEAIVHYRQALKIKPDYAEAYTGLGNVLAAEGRFDEAVEHYQKALRIKPDYVEAHTNLGNALAAEGRFDEAVKHYQQALKIKPDLAGALNGLAWLRATAPKASLRNGPEAIELAQRALRSDGAEQVSILDTLAAAYAEAGRWPEAVSTARKALELATSQHQQTLADELRVRLGLYEAGKPYRQTLSAAANFPRKP